MPELEASFAAGELSFTKVRALTRVATPDDESCWIDTARSSTGAQLERLVAKARASVDRSENAEAQQAWERRGIERSTRSDGLDQLKVVGPSDAVDIVWAAIELVESLIIDDAVSGSGRSRREVMAERGGVAASRFDALEQIAERMVAERPASAERGDVGRLALVIDTEGLAEIAAVDGNEEVPAGELTLGGRRVAPVVAKRWACDIRSFVVLEHDGHVRDEGHTTKVPNRRLRRALHRRDGGSCRFPGCAATKWLHAHHVVHWVHDGPTDLDNLVSLCGFHHKLVHEGGWSVAVTDDVVVWSDPDGVPATVEPLSGDVESLLRTQCSEGVARDAIESRWDGERLDFHFVVSVLASHIARTRTRAESVSAET